MHPTKSEDQVLAKQRLKKGLLVLAAIAVALTFVPEPGRSLAAGPVDPIRSRADGEAVLSST